MEDENKELLEKVKEELKNVLSQTTVSDLDSFLVKSGFKESDVEKEAEEILKKDIVKRKLCAALQTFSEDIVKMAEIVTTVIGTLYAASVIVVSVNLPKLIVFIVLTLFYRMGVAAYCKD